MKRGRVKSEVLSSVGYDESSRTLEVEFKDGRVYRYFDVPRWMFQDFMRSLSKGIFYNAIFRGGFEAKRVA